MPQIPGWRETSLISSKKHFTSQDTCEIFVGSWNVGGLSPPEDLDMHDWLQTQNHLSDIYVLGFQEIVPLNTENILRYENKRGSRKWNSLIRASLNQRVLPNSKLVEEEKANRTDIQQNICTEEDDYVCIMSKQMVGIFLSVWVRNELCQYIKHPSVSSVGCGIMGCFGNKGSVSIRLFIHETSFCFVCCHLASGGKEGDERHRNSNVADILSYTTFTSDLLTKLPQKILDHDRIIWLGDLNYRINLSDSTTRSLVENKEWNILLQSDQLKAELMEGHVFEGWHEEAIEFPPTYKYNLNSDVYFGSNQKTRDRNSRSPAWCDRILWFGKGLKQNQYNRGECKMSDHRPVSARFTAEIEVLRTCEETESFNYLNNHFVKGFQRQISK